MALDRRWLSICLIGLALLAPSLAGAGSASSVLTVQVAPAASSMACDVGPNYTGTVPPGLPAGWICAFNSDFTLAGGFDATLSNWLDVCGAGSPKWYSTPTNGSGNAADCSRYGIVADGGNPQVLHMTFLASDPGISRWGTTLTTTNANLSAGQTFPLGAYWQAIYRIPASTYATVPSGLGSPIAWAWWSWESPQTSVLEWDFIESYSDSTSVCGGPTTQNCGNAATWHDHQSGGGAQTYLDYRRTIDATTYNIYGTRITQNGTSVVGCSYFNNILAPGQAGQGTGTGCSSTVTPAQTTNRQYPILMLGPQGSPTYTPTGTQDAYVKQVTVFACPTWRTTQCPTALLTGPP